MSNTLAEASVLSMVLRVVYSSLVTGFKQKSAFTAGIVLAGVWGLSLPSIVNNFVGVVIFKHWAVVFHSLFRPPFCQKS